EADFNEQLRLLGYQLDQQAEDLSITLYWQPLQVLDADYVAFLHLLDGSGNLAAQVDQAPNSLYPTSWWAPGEIVRQVVSLSLSGLAPGNYHLTSGLYDPITLDRLPLSEGGDSFTLTAIEID
ncbi:MAG: glycosyl transferase, partial [Chloroflexi bacterium]|nr:glycosyl transferase [Chloroflexota bacterium]